MKIKFPFFSKKFPWVCTTEQVVHQVDGKDKKLSDMLNSSDDSKICFWPNEEDFDNEVDQKQYIDTLIEKYGSEFSFSALSDREKAYIKLYNLVCGFIADVKQNKVYWDIVKPMFKYVYCTNEATTLHSFNFIVDLHNSIDDTPIASILIAVTVQQDSVEFDTAYVDYNLEDNLILFIITEYIAPKLSKYIQTLTFAEANALSDEPYE